MKRGALGLTLSVFILSALPSYAVTVRGTLSIGGIQAEGAIVYLESAQSQVPRSIPTHAVIDQKDLTFIPRVLPVVRGTVVEFTNNDDVQHNVFTPSEVAGKFDLGTYSRGETQSVALNEVGEVLILCNIHMEMAAHILVLKDPYFAIVAQDGSYQIPGVPSGTYTLKVWHGQALSDTRPLDVPASGDLTLNLQLKK